MTQAHNKIQLDELFLLAAFYILEAAVPHNMWHSVDALIPGILELNPEVLVVTGDHSTPATFAAHSWHSVPTLIASAWARPTGASFGESECRRGDLGTFEGKHLMTLALAHAGRLAKFGA